MDAESMNDAQRQGEQMRAGVGVAHPALQHIAFLNDLSHARQTAHAGVSAQHVPVMIVGNQARLVSRHFLV